MPAATRTTAAPCPILPGLHALLKQRTGSLHRRLDASPCLLALMRPGLDLPTYADILQRFALAYARIEPLLSTLDHCRPAGLPAYRPRLPALLDELARLSETGPGSVSPLTPPASEAGAHYFGMRYVVEGSTQGARLIFAQLEKNLPQPAGAGFAYWRMQGEAAADWPLFRDCLDQADVEPEALVQGAEAAFSVFIDAFASPAHAT